MLDEKTIRHVGELSKMNLTDEDVKKYQKELAPIMKNINKLNDLNIEGEMLISPTNNKNILGEDIEGEMLTHQEIFKNVKKESDSYVVVLPVIV
jgi:aspartyl/glutamyl-tRNA(Asn/Gln) amidotransferase C subunit